MIPSLRDCYWYYGIYAVKVYWHGSCTNSFFLLIDTRWQYNSHKGISWIRRLRILCKAVLSQTGFEESQCRFVNYDLSNKSVLSEGWFWLFTFVFEKKSLFDLRWILTLELALVYEPFSFWCSVLCAAQNLTRSRHAASHTDWLLFSWTLKEVEVACQLQEAAGVLNQITGGVILIS